MRVIIQSGTVKNKPEFFYDDQNEISMVKLLPVIEKRRELDVRNNRHSDSWNVTVLLKDAGQEGIEECKRLIAGSEVFISGRAESKTTPNPDGKPNYLTEIYAEIVKPLCFLKEEGGN